MDIEYDLLKAKINETKHGISFEEATTALHDPHALVIEDTLCSFEPRFVLLGLSGKARLIIVVYSLRQSTKYTTNSTAESIRIISARKASKSEAKSYA